MKEGVAPLSRLLMTRCIRSRRFDDERENEKKIQYQQDPEAASGWPASRRR